MYQSFKNNNKGKSSFGNTNNLGDESNIISKKKYQTICRVNNQKIVNLYKEPNNKNGLEASLFYTEDLNNINVVCGLNDLSNNQVVCTTQSTLNPYLLNKKLNSKVKPFYFNYKIDSHNILYSNTNCSNYTNFTVLSNSVCNIPYPTPDNSGI
jgi:hypothetical protein